MFVPARRFGCMGQRMSENLDEPKKVDLGSLNSDYAPIESGLRALPRPDFVEFALLAMATPDVRTSLTPVANGNRNASYREWPSSGHLAGANLGKTGTTKHDMAGDNLCEIATTKREIKTKMTVERKIARAIREQFDGVAKDARWWVHPEQTSMCPLTQFPVSLLPYPPFKFAQDLDTSNSHWLVDGKSLALMYIESNGTLAVCGRALQPSDIIALDGYIQRCSLGAFRPSRLAVLQRDVAASKDGTERVKAMTELESFRASARRELKKIRRIQGNRCRSEQKSKRQHHRGLDFDTSVFVSSPDRIASASSLESPVSTSIGSNCSSCSELDL
jgi:hypothetical protein